MLEVIKVLNDVEKLSRELFLLFRLRKEHVNDQCNHPTASLKQIKRIYFSSKRKISAMHSPVECGGQE